MKNITGSAKVVTILNKFGHSISDSQLREWDAAMAEKQLELQKDQATLIPSNINSLSFVTLCWDNNDILEETAHAAQNGSMNIVICSPDTDVAALVVSLLPEPRETNVFLRTGRLSRLRHISIQAVRNHLGPAVSDSLIGLHALTGCDSTSAFKRRGKRNAVEVFKKHPALCLGLQQLGMTFEVTDDLLAACETFVCRLHQARSTCTGVNKVIFELFATKAAQCDQLPPTRDALGLHVAWANYQAGIWRRALQSKPVVPSPCGHGR